MYVNINTLTIFNVPVKWNVHSHFLKNEQINLNNLCSYVYKNCDQENCLFEIDINS